MRYIELNIETQRQAPARARSEGAAMLRRAGYVRGDGEITALGRCSRARLEELAQVHPAREFFELLKLPVVRTEGGEYAYTLDAGKVEISHCATCGYAARREAARLRRRQPEAETPAPVEKIATPEANTIEALAQFLGVSEEKTAKALMYTRITDNKFVFVVVPGDMQLSEEKLERQVGQVRPATTEEIIAAGATPGYASPIGLHEALVVVDDLIPVSPNLVAGANEAGFHLKNTNYGRDYQADIVADLVLVELGAPCPECGSSMLLRDADLLFDGALYNFDLVLEDIAETHHDAKGLTLPAAAAPFDVYLMNVAGKELDTRGQAGKLADEWQQAGTLVLLDDRDERAGVKFADADLIGCPMRATVGERGMRDGMVELKPRLGGEVTLVPFAEVLGHIQHLDKAA